MTNNMTYQQYLCQNPVQNVMPMDYPNVIDGMPVYNAYWNANVYDYSGIAMPLSGYVQAPVELPVGTHLSEIFDFEKNGSNPPVRKKRKFSELENSKDVSAVKLTRDQLLKISSTELEDYLNRLNLGRNLTKYEEKEIKRQRRLVKNREYAQEARKKKKEYVSNIESEVDTLKRENSELSSKVESLEKEVASLRNHIAELEKLSDSGVTSSDESVDHFQLQIDDHSYMYDPMIAQDNWSFNGFQTGMFMMVVLFSFGFLFTQNIFQVETPIQSQSPFGPIPENTLPETSPWKGPRKLSTTLHLSTETRSSCDEYSNQQMTMEDVLSNEEHHHLFKTCPNLNYQPNYSHCPKTCVA